MALEPIQPSAAAALRLETEAAAGLARLVAGDSVEGTVIAGLRNGGVRIALIDMLFESHAAARAGRADVALTGGREPPASQTAAPRPGAPPAYGPSGAPAQPAGATSGRLPAPAGPLPQGDGGARQGEPAPAARPITNGQAPRLDTTIAVPGGERTTAQPAAAPARQAAAPRQAFVDLPAAAGLKVGDAVRLTIVDTAPHLALRVQHISPPAPGANAAALRAAPPRGPSALPATSPTTGQTPAAAPPQAALRPFIDAGALLPQRPGEARPTVTGTAAPAPTIPGEPAAILPPLAASARRDALTLTPDAALVLQSVETEPPSPGAEPVVLSAPARAALASMLPRAAIGQASLAALVANIAALIDSPLMDALPPPLAATIRSTAEAISLTPEALDGPALRRAIADAGPFLEAKVARLATDLEKSAAAPPEEATEPNLAQPNLTQPRPAQPLLADLARLPAIAGDTKNLLLVLRAALQAFVGGETPALPTTENRPPAPRRGAAPVGQRGALPLLPLDAGPREAARHLAADVDGALDRIGLQQAAALPDEPRIAPASHDGPASPDRLVEIPLRLPGETPVLALSVGPDGRPRRPGEPRGWRMRLSLDLADAGRIDGVVGVRGDHATVSLHAVDAETLKQLGDHLGDLRDALTLAGLDVDLLDLRDSALPAPEPARAGSYLDRQS